MSPGERSCLGRLGRFASAVDGNGPDLARLWKGCE
jgi:hypothetical protein